MAKTEYIGRNIWGDRRYQRQVNKNTVVYMKMTKNSEEAVAEFVVGKPGGTSLMSEEETKKYRLGIEGQIGAYAGKRPDQVMIDIKEKGKVMAFGDFYTEEGEVIKNMLLCEKKIFKKDGDEYYEAVSNKEKVGLKSEETILGKDRTHRLKASKKLLRKHKYFANLFIKMFDEVR